MSVLDFGVEKFKRSLVIAVRALENYTEDYWLRLDSRVILFRSYVDRAKNGEMYYDVFEWEDIDNQMSPILVIEYCHQVDARTEYVNYIDAGLLPI